MELFIYWLVISVVVSPIAGIYISRSRRLGAQENKQLRRIREAGL